MTFAWYGHLKNLATSPWYIAALVSWGIALFEYLAGVPRHTFFIAEFERTKQVGNVDVFEVPESLHFRAFGF